jgi:hypothetical protein
MAVNSKRSSNINVGMNYRGVATGVQKIQGYMGQMSRGVNKIQRSFGNLGLSIGAAFSIQQIGRFTEEAINLALQAEGVEKAFNKMANAGDLEKLREATRNLVSDLELMRQANFARSVGIEMEDLAKVMAYVQRYSAATGKAMSELMNDATLEMIRQTGLRLDNIGLNLDTVKKRAKEIGFIPAMIESMETNAKKFGDETQTVSEKVQQMEAAWENSKTSFGETVMPVYLKGLKLLSDGLDAISARFRFGYGASAEMIEEGKDAAKGIAEFTQALKEKGVPDLLIGAQLLGQISKAEKELAEAKEAQEGTTTAEETRQVILLTYKLEALRKEYEKLHEVKVTPTGGGGGGGGGGGDPLSLQEQISIAKKSNKALSELESKGLSKAQVKALDTSISIDLLNSKLSDIPETLATIDSGLTGKPPLSEFQKGIEEMTENVRSMLEGLVTTIAVDFFGAIGEAMVMGSDSFKSFGQQTLEAMGRFFKQIGGMFISYGIAALEFFKTLLVPANAPALIAAGIALSLIGGAISGAAKSMAQTGQPSGAGVPAQSGGMGYNFETRIDGYDLVLVNDRNQRLRNRRG